MGLSSFARLTDSTRNGLRSISGLRTTVAMLSAMSLALYLNLPVIGLGAAFGVFVVGMGDVGGQFRPRIVIVFLAAALAATSAIAASLLGNFIITGVIGMFAIAFFTSLSQSSGYRIFAVFFGAEILYLMSVASPKGLQESLESGGAMFLGSLWAILVLMGWTLFDPIGPGQRQLAVAIRAVADLLADPSNDPESFSQLRAKAGGELTKAGETITSIPSSGSRRSKSNDLAVLLGATRRLWIDVSLVRTAWRAAHGAQQELLLQELKSRTQQLRAAADLLSKPKRHRIQTTSPPTVHHSTSNELDETSRAALRAIDVDVLAVRPDDPPSDANERADLLAYTRLAKTPGVQSEIFSIAPEIRAMRNNLTPRSMAFRYAVRVALITSLTIPVYRLFNIEHGYWLTLTVVIVLQQDFGATLTKGIQRVLGTLIGGIIGWQIASHVQDPWLLALATSMLAGLAVALIKYNYFFYTWALTPFVVILASGAIGSPLATGELRFALTAIGGVIALLAAYYLWPGWGLIDPQVRLAEALDCLLEYTGLVLSDVGSRSPDRTATEKARNADISLSTADAELQRYTALPAGKGGDPKPIQQVLHHAQLALGATHSLARLNDREPATSIDLSHYSKSIAAKIQAAAECLRSVSAHHRVDTSSVPVPDKPGQDTIDLAALSAATATLLTVIETQCARLAYEACHQSGTSSQAD